MEKARKRSQKLFTHWQCLPFKGFQTTIFISMLWETCIYSQNPRYFFIATDPKFFIVWSVKLKIKLVWPTVSYKDIKIEEDDRKIYFCSVLDETPLVVILSIFCCHCRSFTFYRILLLLDVTALFFLFYVV